MPELPDPPLRFPGFDENEAVSSVVSNEWDSLQDDAPLAASETPLTIAQAAELPRLYQERDAVFAWLETHARALIADPASHVESGELETAVNQAITLRELTQSQSEQLHDEVMAQLTGAGAIEPYMSDPVVTEIMVTGDNVFLEQNGTIHAALPLPSKAAAVTLAQHLCRHCKVEYHEAQALYNLTWQENGARMNLVHHSVSPTGVAITIRKRNTMLNLDLPDLLRSGMINLVAAKLLIQAIRGQLNVLLSGSTGTGKTTVLRALAAAAIDPEERLLILEDTEELRLPFAHQVVLIGPAERTDEQASRGVPTLQELFRNTLRMRGDRMIMGELRGPEAFDFLEAGLTDQGGLLSTIHIRRPDLLATRLYWIAQKNALSIPFELVLDSVYHAIDLIVQIDRDGDGRRYVSSIVETLPNGKVHSLFQWDPALRTLTPRDALTTERAQWMVQYQALRAHDEDLDEQMQAAQAEADRRNAILHI